MDVSLYISFIVLLLFYKVISPIPIWSLEDISINLLNSENKYRYTIYNKTSDGIHFILEKEITKINSFISTENYLTVGTTTRIVDFEDIESHYHNTAGLNILICPKGKFHPFDFMTNNYIIPPNWFDDGENWNLKCCIRDTGRFLIIYLMNRDRKFYYLYNGGIFDQNNYFHDYIYDFKLENGNIADGNYEYKFPVVCKDGGYISLRGGILHFPPENVDILFNTLCISRIAEIKEYTQAYFNWHFYLYFFSYNTITDFISGYSTSYINFENREEYRNSVENINIAINDISPFNFDEVEIKEMNFIRETEYVYYKLYNKNNGKTYYGLLDIKLNKILYNIEEEITTFIPLSSLNNVMLAITKTSAYKICIIKNGDSCIDGCPSNNLILDIYGNKCQSTGDNGKIKLMPEEIYINKEDCDLNIYILNSEETECGLCNYFYPNENKYKLVNNTGCISTIPINADFYNEKHNLLKCKTNYHPDNNECIPDFCYETCEKCFDISSDINGQKCLECKNGYYLQSNNCLPLPESTIIDRSIANTTDKISTPFMINITTTINLQNEFSSQAKINILCPDGTFLSSDNTCLNCPNLCKNYEYNICNCTLCLKGYYLIIIYVKNVSNHVQFMKKILVNV